MNKAKVVIIGTGPSGLAAATKLLELGFQKVYLLEAEKRIGGRVYTVPFGDNVVDLGAQWCMGEKGNAVFELAGPQNLLEPTGNVLNRMENIRSNKEKIPLDQEKRLKDIRSDIENSFEKDLLGYKDSFGSFIDNRFQEALKKPENTDIDMEIAKEFLENFKKLQCSSIACDYLEQASAEGVIQFLECEGDQNLIWKDKGYNAFLRLLMKSDEKGTDLGVLDQRVMFGKRVTSIVWNEGQQVKLICEDDDEILADHVIVTVSLGVLKAFHSQLFEPRLPEEKVRAIEGLGFGTINKIVIEFSSQFWPDDWAGCSLLWRKEDLKEIREKDFRWVEDIVVFDTAKYKPRILFGWMIGPNGRRMETLPEEEVLKGIMYVLRRFLPWDIPHPEKLIRSQWSSNGNFMGSYSFISIVTDKMQTGAGDLEEPLKFVDGKPVVLFAGEATSKHHFGSVHGAVETGRREAERLAKLYEGA